MTKGRSYSKIVKDKNQKHLIERGFCGERAKMNTIYEQNEYLEALQKMQIDCGACSGICCAALYYAKSEGFPCDKAPGEACRYLAKDFKCQIHDALGKKHLKGCMAYDCFGAGQFVMETFYKNTNWRKNPAIKDQLFETFLKVEQLFQMKNYLLQTAAMAPASALRGEVEGLLKENEALTLKAPTLSGYEAIEAHRDEVNKCIQKAADAVHYALHQKPRKITPGQYLGKNFKCADLTGKDFTVSLLIAANLEGCKLVGANFLGADMRDTNIKNTDLSESLYLSQGQINAAKGNRATKLPSWLNRPISWEE